MATSLWASGNVEEGGDPGTDQAKKGTTRTSGWQQEETASQLPLYSRTDCSNNATPARRPEAVGWAPLVGRPADYLPSGTVGQWLPAPCNGGTCRRGATLEPTKRRRELTHYSRSGNPRRPRPNCHKKENSRTAWVASVHRREGAQEPRCARSEGRRGAVGFYLVVAATTGIGGITTVVLAYERASRQITVFIV